MHYMSTWFSCNLISCDHVRLLRLFRYVSIIAKCYLIRHVPYKTALFLSTNLLLKFQCFHIASRIEAWEWHGNLSNPNIPLLPICNIVNIHAHVFIQKVIEKGTFLRF